MVKKAVVVVNQKGGVGKTTVSFNIACAAAEMGSTLTGDGDPQGNLSLVLTQDIDIRTKKKGFEQLFGKAAFRPRSTIINNVELLHGHRGLELLQRRSSANQQAADLRDFVRNLPYDYLVFDTPPALGPLQLAPIFWADVVVVPVEATFLSMSSIPDMLNTVEEARKVNPHVVVKYVINRFNSRSASEQDHLAKMQQSFGENLMETFILSQAVSDAVAAGIPVWENPKARKQKKQWREFCRQVLS